LQVGPAGVLEQFGQFQAHGRILIEQQLFEHRPVDRYHLLQIDEGEIHGVTGILSGLMTTEDFPRRRRG